MARRNRRSNETSTKNRVCKVDGCGGEIYARGMCGRHYRRELYHRHRPPPKPAPNEIVEREHYAELVIRDQACSECARAWIDFEDMEAVAKHRWRLGEGIVSPRDNTSGLPALKKYLLNPGAGRFTAVLNGEEMDLRRSNLRPVDRSELTSITHFRPKLNLDYLITAAPGGWNAVLICGGERHDAGDHKTQEEARAAALVVASAQVERHWLAHEKKRRGDQ